MDVDVDVDHIVMDLEASCWEAAWVRHRMETIEIGAVRLDAKLAEVDEFVSFVRPVVVPRLSSFCRNLTSISQEQVDAADTFPSVFAGFVRWLGPRPYRLVTWGAFDLGQLRMDCQRHDMVFPQRLADSCLNLKTEFTKRKGLDAQVLPAEMEMGQDPVEVSSPGSGTTASALCYTQDGPTGT